MNGFGRENEPTQSAEWHALEHMIALGFIDAVFSEAGIDRDIQVWAADAIAQVKRYAQHPVPAADVRQLKGWTYRSERAIFYALDKVGYTREARAAADELDVALFLYDIGGTCTPTNAIAQALVDAAPAPAVELPLARPSGNIEGAGGRGARAATRGRAEFDAVRDYLHELDGWQRSVDHEHERVRAPSIRQHMAFHRLVVSGDLLAADSRFSLVRRHAQISLRIDGCLVAATVVRDDFARYIQSIRMKDAKELATSGWVRDLRPWSSVASTLSDLAGPVEELADAMSTFDIHSFTSRRLVSRLHRRIAVTLAGMSRRGPNDGPALQLLADESIRSLGKLEQADRVCALIISDVEGPRGTRADRLRRLSWADTPSAGDAVAPEAQGDGGRPERESRRPARRSRERGTSSAEPPS